MGDGGGDGDPEVMRGNLLAEEGGMKTKKEHWRGGGGGVQAMLDLQGWPQQLILCVSFG